jgi:hypothetical protein
MGSVRRFLFRAIIFFVFFFLLLEKGLGRAQDGFIPEQERERPHPAAVRAAAPSSDLRGDGQEDRLREWSRLVIGEVEDEFLQIKILHDWVVLNISYDTQALSSGRIPSQEIDAVLKNKKGVCEGYARLFRALARAAGFECEIIRGEVRLPLQKKSQTTLSHAWNAVKVGGEWYLVDTTWDAGFLTGDSYQSRYATTFLFKPPEELIFTHFPDNPRWQLLSIPLTKAEFFKQPLLIGPYFSFFSSSTLEGMSQGENLPHPFAVDFFPTKELRLFAQIRIGEKRLSERHIWADKSGKTLRLSFLFPQAGDYTLLFFASDSPDDRPLELIGEIAVFAPEGVFYVYPLVYADFIQKGGRILSSLNPLSKGEMFDFKFQLPGFEKALLVAGEKQFHLNRGPDDIFTLQLLIPDADELFLFGGVEEDSEEYKGLLLYSIYD